MSDTESIDLNSAALLDEDTIPNANQSIDCFSCGKWTSPIRMYLATSLLLFGYIALSQTQRSARRNS